MPDYSQGKIYAIRSHQTDDIYIGSTSQPLSRRIQGHRSDYKQYLKDQGKKYCKSFIILKFEDHYIELIEECKCENKDQLLKREGELIRTTDCVNAQIPGRDKTQFYQENKELYSNRQKEYINNHPERRKAVAKRSYDKNKHKWKETIKKYLNDPDVITRNSTITNCECGGKYQHKTRSTHFKTERHKRYIEPHQ